jgi:hypothetical protein
VAEYTKEMGKPPIDIDQLSALPPAQRASGEKKAAAQTKKDYPPPKPAKAPVKKMAGGGSVTRGDGCVTKGHTKGRVM